MSLHIIQCCHVLYCQRQCLLFSICLMRHRSQPTMWGRPYSKNSGNTYMTWAKIWKKHSWMSRKYSLPYYSFITLYDLPHPSLPTPFPHSLSHSSLLTPILITCPIHHYLPQSSLPAPIPHYLPQSSLPAPFLISYTNLHYLPHSSLLTPIPITLPIPHYLPNPHYPSPTCHLPPVILHLSCLSFLYLSSLTCEGM